MMWNDSTDGPLTSYENCMAKKNLVLKLWPKKLSANEISVFVNVSKETLK